MPGAGLKSQWVNLLSTAIIGGVVVTLVIFQTRSAKAGTRRCVSGLTVAFREVAGIVRRRKAKCGDRRFPARPKKYQRLGWHIAQRRFADRSSGNRQDDAGQSHRLRSQGEFFQRSTAAISTKCSSVWAPSVCASFSGKPPEQARHHLHR